MGEVSIRWIVGVVALVCIDASACPLAAIVGDPKARLDVLAVAQKTNSPAFVKTTTSGEIPVLLITPETAERYRDFLTNSFGTSVRYQPMHKHDHGGVRFGTQMSEMDGPVIAVRMRDGEPQISPRQASQVNRTGVVRLDVFENVAHRDGGSRAPRIEVAYRLSPEEMEVARFYHQVRRAGLIRIPFRKGTFTERGDFIPAFELPASMTAGVPDATEMCFDFSKGTRLNLIQQHVENKLKQVSHRDYADDPRIVQFLAKAREKLSAVDKESKERQIELLSGNALVNLGLEREAHEALNEPGTEFDQTDATRAVQAVNLMLAHQSIIAYRKLLKSLGVSPDQGYQDMNHPRATAVLIYDGTPSAGERFRKGTYSSDDGVFSQWTIEGQRPLLDRVD